MAKKDFSYVCNNCLEKFITWSGKCPNCGSWNSIEENLSIGSDSKINGKVIEGQGINNLNFNDQNNRLILTETHINNLLGGGLVKGSVILLAGEPGVGKSTLLLGLSNQLEGGAKLLYISAEESLNQLYMRAKRMNVKNQDLKLYSVNFADNIISTIKSKSFALITIY